MVFFKKAASPCGSACCGLVCGSPSGSPMWGGQVGFKQVCATNCVWTIQDTDDQTNKPPLGMVIAYVDDLIAVGDQVYLDSMKSELDKLYVMKTSGSIPAVYAPGKEPLRFLGCLIERLPDGQLIMHQRSYIEHCIKESSMELMRSLITLMAC